METIWLAIETPRHSIHDDINLIYSKIKCSPGDFNQETVRELLSRDDLILLDSFKSEKEAKAFGRNLLNKSARDYTRVINKLPDLKPVSDRPFLVKIGEEVTKTPRVYLMKKVDYEKLQEAFPSVRLATDEEVDSAESFISTLIPLDYELMKSLRLRYFRVISPPDGLPVDHYYEFCESFEESRKLLGEFREYCILLSQESDLIQKEDAIALGKKLFGDKAEKTVDQLVQIFQDLAAGREVDMSGTLTVGHETDDDIDYGVEKVKVTYA